MKAYMELLEISSSLTNYGWLVCWIASLLLCWKFKDKFFDAIETQARYFLAYGLISGILLLIFKGKALGISDEYHSNLTTELIGIAITVFLIDRVFAYINAKNEELFRELSLRGCRMPIFTYCANWLAIYEWDRSDLNTGLGRYENLSAFFKSDEFYRKVIRFDFNKQIAPDKTYAQYYHEKFVEVNDRFQNILAKYASKLFPKDLVLLEHFGGQAYIFTVFAVMKFISEVNFTHTRGDEEAKQVMPFNNNLGDISRENFNKHFDRLLELIDAYNSVAENDAEKWTIKNISRLQTIESANNNPATDW